MLASRRLLATSRRSPVLAVMNVGRQRAALDDPIMSEFAKATEPVNALARATPGFVWSYDNDDPAVRATVNELVGDPLLQPQLSVWRDVESLRHFAFKSGHAMYFKRKREWFDEIPPPFSVLWWREPETLPSMLEAFERLRFLRDHGPSAHAFTFKSARDFPPALSYESRSSLSRRWENETAAREISRGPSIYEGRGRP